jgi:hypothetical protein
MLANSSRTHKTSARQGKSNPERQLVGASTFSRGSVKEGTVYAFLADHRRDLLRDEDFADLFPRGGDVPRSRSTSSAR